MFDLALTRSERKNEPRSVFILFCGHNDRAVISLCRFFNAYDLPFAIICSHGENAIRQTDWADKCIISRIDKKLNIQLFDTVSRATKNIYGKSAQPVYCPTTEYMNHFVLNERDALVDLGWRITLPPRNVYASLTSKAISQEIVRDIIGIPAPPTLPWAELKAPCVLKPRINIREDCVYYPKLCNSENELHDALINLDRAHWFAQKWIYGQSYYLCAYVSKDGCHAHFWQQNLLQQPGGKSVVLARTTNNPGIATNRLFDGLISLGYYGPLMMEVIRDDLGNFYYVEINPRFWGPLQLALDACPSILQLFVQDAGVQLDSEIHLVENVCDEAHWYSWLFGAETAGYTRYPAAENIELTVPLDKLLNDWDVYARPDTSSLHGRY